MSNLFLQVCDLLCFPSRPPMLISFLLCSLHFAICNILEISTRNFWKRCILNDYIYKYIYIYIYIYISIIQCICIYVLGRNRNSGGQDMQVRLIKEEKSITGRLWVNS